MTLTGCKELWSDDMIVLPHRTFPYQALELLQGKQFNMSQTPNGFTIGGGLKAYTSTITFPKNLEYAQDVFPVTVSTATADALKVDTGTKREFKFGDKTYTFQATKVFHFTQNSNSNLEQGVSVAHSDSSGANNKIQYANTKDSWKDSKDTSQTGNRSGHVLGFKILNGESATITISNLEEFDYVEFSFNSWWHNEHPTITLSNGTEAGKIVYKSISNNGTGIGFGNWEKADNKDFIPVLGNGACDSYTTKIEQYVVCGAYNGKGNDAVLFMQNATITPTLENQAAVLLERSDTSQLYKSGSNFTLKIEGKAVSGSNTPEYWLDYIAFFKKQ